MSSSMSPEIFFRTLFHQREMWFAVAFFVCIFTMLTFRPQRIRRPGSFRLSCILFALYIILPGCINILVWDYVADPSNRIVSHHRLISLQVPGVLANILIGLSTLFALGSIRPGPHTEPASTEN